SEPENSFTCRTSRQGSSNTFLAPILRSRLLHDRLVGDAGSLLAALGRSQTEARQTVPAMGVFRAEREASVDQTVPTTAARLARSGAAVAQSAPETRQSLPAAGKAGTHIRSVALGHRGDAAATEEKRVQRRLTAGDTLVGT